MDPAIPRLDGPAAGDLVITDDTATEHGHTLRTWPGPAQLRYSTYDRALEKAKQWSAASGVTIWNSKDNAVFMRAVVIEVRRAV